jgi:hypothetical protein
MPSRSAYGALSEKLTAGKGKEEREAEENPKHDR